MRNFSKIFASFFLVFFVVNCYAIDINVRSTSSKIMGLGFTVNGAKHGGVGNKYHASGMPKGNYAFGVRVHGKDVPCLSKDGKKTINITQSTSAVLNVKGRHCTVETNSK